MTRASVDIPWLVVNRAVTDVLFTALEDCRWELNELDNETHGQHEARINAEWALSFAQDNTCPDLPTRPHKRAKGGHYDYCSRCGAELPGDNKAVERQWELARVLSIPEHHTTWDLLTDEQKDLYFMQAGYAIAHLDATSSSASAIEARRAETGNTGSVHESAVGEAETPGGNP